MWNWNFLHVYKVLIFNYYTVQNIVFEHTLLHFHTVFTKKQQLKLSKGFLFDIKKPTIFYNIQNNFLGKCWKKNYWHFFKVSWLSKKGYTCCKSCKKKISIMILYICLAFQVQQVKIQKSKEKISRFNFKLHQK